jgi:Leucine-rich repeat (LRR) protein
MDYLNIGDQGLSKMPPLPRILRVLYCDGNRLTELGKLPNGLKRLDCERNRLTELGELPRSLETLFCYENPLTELPPLPRSLEHILVSPWQVRSCLNQLGNLETSIKIINW